MFQFNHGIAYLLSACVFASTCAQAQDYPSKPIRVITSVTGGGETNARIVSGKIAEELGVPMVVEAQPAILILILHLVVSVEVEVHPV